MALPYASGEKHSFDGKTRGLHTVETENLLENG
jgi:hypothetical protein